MATNAVLRERKREWEQRVKTSWLCRGTVPRPKHSPQDVRSRMPVATLWLHRKDAVTATRGAAWLYGENRRAGRKNVNNRRQDPVSDLGADIKGMLGEIAVPRALGFDWRLNIGGKPDSMAPPKVQRKKGDLESPNGKAYQIRACCYGVDPVLITRTNDYFKREQPFVLCWLPTANSFAYKWAERMLRDRSAYLDPGSVKIPVLVIGWELGKNLMTPQYWYTRNSNGRDPYFHTEYSRLRALRELQDWGRDT